MEQSDTDRRRAVRRRVFKAGTICSPKLGTSTECTVRNLSEMGACLVVVGQSGIPSQFHLVLESDKAVKRCQVAWRTQDRIGVAFR